MSEETGNSDGEVTGVVKWFNDAKGFGFIEHTNGKDVFVHYSVIESSGFKTLKDGEQVLYDFKEGPKGLHAVKVRRKDAPQNVDAPAQEATTTATAQADSASTSSDSTSSERPAQLGNAGRLAAQIVKEVIPNQSDSESASPAANPAVLDKQRSNL